MVSLIKSIRTNSGVEELIAENYLGYQNYNDDIQLEEGLVFFKNSKRLTKLAFKMDKKSNKAKNPVYREELQKLSTKMKEAAKDFEVLENKYKAARGSDKKKVKEEFAGLKKNYSDLVSMVNKETVRKAILSVGLGALTAFSIFNLYGFIVSAGGLSPAVATATAEASKLLSGARNVVTQRLEKAFQFIKQNPKMLKKRTKLSALHI